MSLDIDWDKLVSDTTFTEGLRDFLDEQFKSISLPSYIDSLSVTNVNIGSIPPAITIRHIGDPFAEFYHDDDDIEERLKKMTNFNPYESEDDSDDSETSDVSGLPPLAEDLNSQPQAFPQLKLNTSKSMTPDGSRMSLDSLSLIMGNNNLNFTHNNINNLGIGNLNSPSRSDSPRLREGSLALESAQRMNYSELKLERGGGGQDQDHKENGHKDHNHKDNIHKDHNHKDHNHKQNSDLQLIVELDYQGNLELEITVKLLVNYPSPNFISLPIKLRITDLVIHSIAVIAYIDKAVYISFLCDINDQVSDYFTSRNVSETSNHNSGGNFVDYVTGSNSQERIDIIKKVRIESEIGGDDHNVLRNVGKVEKFLTDRLRGIIRDEIAWPSWICLDLKDEEEEEEEEEGDDDDDDYGEEQNEEQQQKQNEEQQKQNEEQQQKQNL